MSNLENKLKIIRNMAQYAMDHYQIINEKNADEIIEKFSLMMDHICENICGGIYHCSDGCPIYFFLDDIKALTKDECEKS